MTEIKVSNNLDRVEKVQKLSWFIAEKWFRILEFALILGALHYFTETLKNNIPLRIVYLLSWVFLWGWFEDTANLVAERINSHKKLSRNKRVFVWVLCTIFVMLIYLLVISATNSMTTK